MPAPKAVAEKAKNPSPNNKLAECQKSRIFTFTPEYVSFEDIQDQEGHIIVKKASAIIH